MHTDSLPRSDRDDVPESTDTTTAEPTLKERFAQHLSDEKLSHAKAAKRLGASATAVTQYLNGNYPGDVPKLERKIVDFLDNEARRRLSGVETVECEQTVEIRTALELIRRTNDVGVIMGESGEGKTRAIDHYVANNPTCVVFRVRSWTSDRESVESAMMDAVGRDGYDNMTKRAVWLIKKLAGSSRLLIVDDAHKLTRPALQWVFDFHDATAIPVGLIGTYALKNKLEDDPQRFRRVGYRMELKPEKPAELIAHLIRTFAPTAGRETAKLELLCAQVAEKRGHFGDVHKQLKLAAEIKAQAPSLTWVEAFQAAHAKLFRDYVLNT